MDGYGELDGGKLDNCGAVTDGAFRERVLDGEEDCRETPPTRDQFVRPDAAVAAGGCPIGLRGDALQLRCGLPEPAGEIRQVDDLADGHRPRLRDAPVHDLDRGIGGGEDVAQVLHGELRIGELLFQRPEVEREHLRACSDVGAGQHLLDGVDRHVQVPQGADDLGVGDLVRAVQAVAVVRVHDRRDEDVVVVVEPKRFRGHPHRTREVADGHQSAHDSFLLLRVSAGTQSSPSSCDSLERCELHGGVRSG